MAPSRNFFSVSCLSPAQLGVDVFEAVAEDAAHVSHVEEHEGDAEDGVQYRRQFPQIGLRSQIAIS